jgi:hypothetical protein
MSGKMGAEVTTFPSPEFVVGVEFRGVPNETGKVRYFWVTATAIFNEGHTPDNPQHIPDVPYVDLSIVPVTNEIELRGNSLWHTASAREIAPIEIHRDIRLGTQFSATVRAYGFKQDVQVPLTDHGALRAFYQTAVDLIGMRVLTQAVPGDNPLFHGDVTAAGGVDFGAVKLQGGLEWGLSSSVALRLMLGGRADGALLVSGEPRLLATADVFARAEVALRFILTRWSIFTQAGARMQAEEQSADFTRSYGYLQIGLSGSYY